MTKRKKRVQKNKETFKEYCKFVRDYRQDDLSYAPQWIRLAEIIAVDISFPRMSWYRRLENNSDAFKEYKEAIEEYLKKKYADEAVQQSFQGLWDTYRRFVWLEDLYYIKHHYHPPHYERGV